MNGKRRTKIENMGLILQQIWYEEGISRIEIAKRVGLNKSTVTNLVAELIELGLVEEREQKNVVSTGGRKPIALGLNKEYGVVIGVGVQAEAMRAVTVDLAGTVLLKWQKNTGPITRRNFIPLFLEAMEELSQILEEKGYVHVLGVGIGAGGIINPEDGSIVYSIPLSIYEPFQVCAELAEFLDVPVFVENDSNCCAWGELAFKKGESYKDFIFVLVEFKEERSHIKDFGGVGVGFGIVLDGRLHYGHTFSAGEFRSAFSEGTMPSQFSLSPEELAQLPHNRVLLDKFLHELFSNLACIVNTLNVSHVFFGGDIEGLGEEICDTFMSYVRRNWMYPLPIPCNVSLSSLHDFAVAYGAAGMILDRIFRNRLHQSFWDKRGDKAFLPVLVRHTLPLVKRSRA